ncbi:MAG TPA: hypothetical protein VM618_11050 [Acidimicrobiia bacterium]|nr:hypothetical protein [Acidimicrobiia bacterium]
MATGTFTGAVVVVVDVLLAGGRDGAVVVGVAGVAGRDRFRRVGAWGVWRSGAVAPVVRSKR